MEGATRLGQVPSPCCPLITASTFLRFRICSKNITSQLLNGCPALATFSGKHLSSSKKASFSLLASRCPCQSFSIQTSSRKGRDQIRLSSYETRGHFQVYPGQQIEHDSHLSWSSPSALGERDTQTTKLRVQGTANERTGIVVASYEIPKKPGGFGSRIKALQISFSNPKAMCGPQKVKEQC